MVFLITYDLKSINKDYSSLYNKITELGSDCFHPIESVWFLKSSSEPNLIVEELRKVLNDDDILFVVNITNQPMQGWLPKPAWDWLEKQKI